MSSYRSLEALLCWSGIPGCPATLIFILPIMALLATLSIMKATGAQNPLLPAGTTLTTLAATSLAIAPNPAMVVMVIVGAAGTAITFLWMRRG